MANFLYNMISYRILCAQNAHLAKKLKSEHLFNKWSYLLSTFQATARLMRKQYTQKIILHNRELG